MKYILITHSYEGLDGELTQNSVVINDYDEANRQFDATKNIIGHYLDSFVILLKVDGKFNTDIIRSYYALPDSFENKFPNYDKVEE